MKKIIAFVILLWPVLALTTEYPTPACYENTPPSCSFDEMTLSLCNKEGESMKIVFLLSHRMYMPGGNKFGSADGGKVCIVQGIKGTDPKTYAVAIQ